MTDPDPSHLSSLGDALAYFWRRLAQRLKRVRR